MLAAIPANDLAETLRVLAGDNAGNAARHFGKHSYDTGDVAAAILWSLVAQSADLMVRPRDERPETSLCPIPLRMRRQPEAIAGEVPIAALALDGLLVEPPPEPPAPASAAMRSASVLPVRKRKRGVYCQTRKSAVAFAGSASRPLCKVAIRARGPRASKGQRWHRLALPGSASLRDNPRAAPVLKNKRIAKASGLRLRRIKLFAPMAGATRRKAAKR
ncbi:MAG TPA: hypothetical protein VIF14_14190 [Alphaproteobacteria bacterium]|jgi:hypothetical protein